MKFFGFEAQTVRSAAFYFTLVESVSGLIASILCVLLYFCVFEVSCPEYPSTQFNNILFTLYESYFIDPRCTLNNVPLYTPNNSSLTQPEVIFYWQASSIALYLVWLSTAYVIYQTKPVTINSCVFWIIVTVIISIVDIVFSLFILTDYKNLPAQEDVNNCPSNYKIPQNTTTYNQNIATTILLIYSSRGGVFLVINLFLALAVISDLDKMMKRLSTKTKSLKTEDVSRTKVRPAFGKQASEVPDRGSYLDKIGRPTLPEGTSHKDIINRSSLPPVDNDLDNAFNFLDSYPENKRNNPVGARKEVERTSSGRYSYEPIKVEAKPRRMEGLGLSGDQIKAEQGGQNDSIFNIPRVKVPVVTKTLPMHTGTPGAIHGKERKKSLETREHKKSSSSGNQQKASDNGPRRYFIPLKD